MKNTNYKKQRKRKGKRRFLRKALNLDGNNTRRKSEQLEKNIPDFAVVPCGIFKYGFILFYFIFLKIFFLTFCCSKNISDPQTDAEILFFLFVAVVIQLHAHISIQLIISYRNVLLDDFAGSI